MNFFKEILNALRNTAIDLRLSLITSLKGQKCFSCRGAKLRNALAREVKQGPTPIAFKQKLLLSET